MCSPPPLDRAPAEVVATARCQYLCSERTMYRILAANQGVSSHPRYTKPELVATGANET